MLRHPVSFWGIDKSVIMKMWKNRRSDSAVSSVFMHTFLFDDIFKYCRFLVIGCRPAVGVAVRQSCFAVALLILGLKLG